MSFQLKNAVRDAIRRTDSGYRFLLSRTSEFNQPLEYPNAPWENAVLKSKNEVEAAITQISKLGLPSITYGPKNWDSLAALDAILRSTDRNAHIFDAGGELYSIILPWLFLYGYKKLLAGNLVFSKPIKKGPIVYQYEDITNSSFPPETFDAITCLSVIEHGVDLDKYFKEMLRILKPGGLLITSTDYYETEIETGSRFACGEPVHIFTRTELAGALNLAHHHGFLSTGQLDLEAKERVVHWDGMDYTFAIFSLRKA